MDALQRIVHIGVIETVPGGGGGGGSPHPMRIVARPVAMTTPTRSRFRVVGVDDVGADPTLGVPSSEDRQLVGPLLPDGADERPAAPFAVGARASI